MWFDGFFSHWRLANGRRIHRITLLEASWSSRPPGAKIHKNTTCESTEVTFWKVILILIWYWIQNLRKKLCLLVSRISSKVLYAPSSGRNKFCIEFWSQCRIIRGNWRAEAWKGRPKRPKRERPRLWSWPIRSAFSMNKAFKNGFAKKVAKKLNTCTLPRFILGAIFHEQCIQKSMHKWMLEKYANLSENVLNMTSTRGPKSMTNLWNFGTCDFFFFWRV